MSMTSEEIEAMRERVKLFKNRKSRVVELDELTSELFPESAQGFSYILSLSDVIPEGKIVNDVTFNISRYGLYKFFIPFEEPQTVSDAIKVVEHFLSAPIDQEYFDIVKDDLFPGTKLKDLKIRGDCLGTAIFIEDIIFYEDGGIGFSMGS